MSYPAQHSNAFATAVNYIASAVGKPVIFGPNGRPVKSAGLQYRRTGAKREGSLKNWIPTRLFDNSSEAREREFIAERAVDLVNNDPHAAGIVDTFATTVIGAGLRPNLALDREILGLSTSKIEKIQKEQLRNFDEWWPIADAFDQLSFGAIQYLCLRNAVQFGEYIVLIRMLNDPARPFAMACQVVHPLRLKTPTDITNPLVRDGVETDKAGNIEAYWIKKTGTGIKAYDNGSKNFIRFRRKAGHRWQVIHRYVVQDSDQVRGYSLFGPAKKQLRDLNDYLDAELISNIVTASFALFIETVGDPLNMAQNFGTITETGYKSDNSTYDQRYQEMVPGQIMYGNEGEKPHAIAANRPGTTFEPFTKIIKKAISQSMNIPYPVLFKDFDGMNFASYRSAMLEAWRVFQMMRTRMGEDLCQPCFDMLQEEAYLKNQLTVRDFYGHGRALTKAQWIGPPKGQIEPIKEINADILAIQNNLKSRTQSCIERGTVFENVTDLLEKEQATMGAKGLDEQKIDNSMPAGGE